jgi:hypothetical protein
MHAVDMTSSQDFVLVGYYLLEKLVGYGLERSQANLNAG